MWHSLNSQQNICSLQHVFFNTSGIHCSKARSPHIPTQQRDYQVLRTIAGAIRKHKQSKQWQMTICRHPDLSKSLAGIGQQQLKFPDHPATRRFCLVSSVWIRWAIRVSGACAKLLKESSPRTLDWSPAVSRQDGEPGVCRWKLGAGVLWSILMAIRSLGIKVERKMSPDRCLDTNPSLDERSHCVPTPYYGTSALYEVGWFNGIQENLKNQTC